MSQNIISYKQKPFQQQQQAQEKFEYFFYQKKKYQFFIKKKRVELKCVTWSKDSHGLFDYESKSVDITKYRLDTTCSIMRLTKDIFCDPSKYNYIINFQKREIRTCRICLSEEEQSEENPFINPCSCKGSCEYMHVSCIKLWIESKVHKKVLPNITSYKWKNLECEVCKLPLPKSVYINNINMNLIDIERPEQSDQPYLIMESISREKRVSKGLHILRKTPDDDSVKLSKNLTEAQKQYEEHQKQLKNTPYPQPLYDIINDLDYKGWNTLHYCIYFQNEEILEFVLQKYQPNINNPTANGWLPLHLAIFTQNLEIIKTLTENNDIQINKQTEIGSPLHLACAKGYLDIVKILVQKGADIKDLKPQNILIFGDGHIKLADFGLSKMNVKESQSALTLCGSPAYIAPELVLGKGAFRASDVYGIGCVLYEMLCGKPHIFNENGNLYDIYEQILYKQFTLPEFLSEEIKEVLQGCLEKDYKKRICIQSLKKMKAFEDLDWEKVFQKKYQPPLFVFENGFLVKKKKINEDLDCDFQNFQINNVENWSFL
ncbi:protein kinase domain protein [Ichthyophthirius multifiliis]|uniref:Protein kinase domain protein n=1 Tax=Ichthyophthirius multifiliis TaxID=5932 RepID=G0QVW4_ICHMU|nr:protein kinase domain protein [Ichthyophthirius multifiliis]EGR30629.1 protein kinase domain protein [Ichthyophthirius multifiliis]|eukprot:XP_004032216.1 protein kinase domain protein [Ichthyophthirius multifiliis]